MVLGRNPNRQARRPERRRCWVRATRSRRTRSPTGRNRARSSTDPGSSRGVHSSSSKTRERLEVLYEFGARLGHAATRVGSRVEAGGARHPRGLPRAVRRPRVPAAHARHVDACSSSTRAPNTRYDLEPPSRRTWALRMLQSCRRTSCTTVDSARHRRLPQTGALRVGPTCSNERMTGRAVDDPDVEDTGARPAACTSPPSTPCGIRREALAAECVLAVVGARLSGASRATGARRPSERPDGGVDVLILRDLLDEHRFGSLTLAEAGRILHALPPISSRCFSRRFGIAAASLPPRPAHRRGTRASAPGGAHRARGDERRLPRSGAPHPALQATRGTTPARYAHVARSEAGSRLAACGKLAM